MKIYGYAEVELEDKMLEMNEVTISLSQKELQELILFMKECDEKMNSPNWDHEHFKNNSMKPFFIIHKENT